MDQSPLKGTILICFTKESDGNVIGDFRNSECQAGDQFQAGDQCQDWDVFINTIQSTWGFFQKPFVRILSNFWDYEYLGCVHGREHMSCLDDHFPDPK